MTTDIAASAATAATPVTAAPTTASAPRDGAKKLGRRADISVRVLQILLALAFAIPSASPKLVGHWSAAETFDEIGWGDWLMYAVGALELAGAVALVIPILSSASATALTGLMIGAFITQMTVFDGQYALTPLLFSVPLVLVAWTRRHHNKALLALVLRRRV
ncbi:MULTISPECIES: DoxX family protein [Streptomyces]|uniref:DoxX family protein n=1 Tax=Streptomyces TaxID=1883 RepID=UPI001317709D|nr:MULTISPECIES: DoxX family protein [Streptomyces]QGZ48413.1 DoxX family protein [Streptomyces sp. QHH-9511]GGT65397.1 membrane protein [Streptomyces lateritius]